MKWTDARTVMCTVCNHQFITKKSDDELNNSPCPKAECPSNKPPKFDFVEMALRGQFEEKFMWEEMARLAHQAGKGGVVIALTEEQIGMFFKWFTTDMCHLAIFNELAAKIKAAQEGR